MKRKILVASLFLLGLSSCAMLGHQASGDIKKPTLRYVTYEVGEITPHHTTVDFDYVAGEADDTLYIGLSNIHREPEDHRVAALYVADAEAVSEFVNEYALLIKKGRHHAGALDFHGLIDENDQDDRDQNGQRQIAHPGYRVEPAVIFWHPARCFL